MAAQAGHTDALLRIQGVVGTAVGLAEAGPVIKILTEHPGVTGLPRTLDGVPVVVQVTGKLFALPKPPGTPGKGPGGDNGDSIDPTSRFNRPVPTGVSTGNKDQCSAGTIGARVRNGNTVYALSNNHVYALENNAPINSEVLQPGRFDSNCANDPNNVIGTLTDYEPIIFGGLNTIDAAIAISSTADLGNATPGDGYGTPISVIVQASLNQKVQKYGRTTSLTKGRITGIHASVFVGYSSGTALFVDQIIVESNKPVIKAGDSGSLLVTDPDRNPVGLLFAGNQSGKMAIANRIDFVLNRFNVQIDGE
jgi:hypothetical protein